MIGLEQMTPAGQENTEPVVMPDDEVLYELADLFRVFGDSTRIKILHNLTFVATYHHTDILRRIDQFVPNCLSVISRRNFIIFLDMTYRLR